MVLLVIAVVIGAVSVGGDVLRHAQSQRIFSDFVMGWSRAFVGYKDLTGVPLGDDPLHPTYVIHGDGGSSDLCNNTNVPTLSNLLLSRSIDLPSGWTVGQEDRYVYQDSNGSPHQLRVCFRTVENWSVQGTSSGLFMPAKRHVMKLTGLTSELAMELDSLIDGKQDARFGRFRSVSASGNLSASSVDWPPVKTNTGNDNIGEIEAYLEMN